MHKSIESLEPRRFLSAATNSDIVAIVGDERSLILDLNAAYNQEATIRGAVRTDLNRVGLFRSNVAAFNTLGKDETIGFRTSFKDAVLLRSITNANDSSLVAHANYYLQHPNQVAVQMAFGTALAKFQQAELASQQTFIGSATTASTGAAVSDFTALAALDPSNPTLQSDVQFGISNLSTTAASLTGLVGSIASTAQTLISDSSNIQVYGDQDLLGAGFSAKAVPFAGAVLKYLAPNATSIATNKYAGPETFAPSGGDFSGTDQNYVGSTQLPVVGQLAGPQVLTLNYSALVQLGHPISTLTLGIATNGFENPTINSPYTVTINGVENTTLEAVLNSLDDADRVEQFVSIGLDPAQLLSTKVLTISIDQPGGGSSGWAVDFLTVGIKNS